MSQSNNLVDYKILLFHKRSYRQWMKVCHSWKRTHLDGEADRTGRPSVSILWGFFQIDHNRTYLSGAGGFCTSKCRYRLDICWRVSTGYCDATKFDWLFLHLLGGCIERYKMDKTFAEGNIWKQESYRSLDFSTFTVEVRVNMNIMHFLSPETAFPLASDITGLKHHTFTGLRANKEGSFNIQIYKDLVFFLILVSQFHQPTFCWKWGGEPV